MGILGIKRIKCNPEVIVQARMQVLKVPVLEDLLLNHGQLLVFGIYVFLIAIVSLVLVGFGLCLLELTSLLIVVSVDVMWVIQQAGNSISLISGRNLQDLGHLANKVAYQYFVNFILFTC